jgi:formate dehydrogenase major subunit
MLVKKSNGAARGTRLSQSFAPVVAKSIDRRAFLARSGLVAGGLTALGALPLAGVRQAEAAAAGPLASGATRIKSVCTHCSVGCTVIAEVKNGVWIGQEPGYDSPFNLGSHCAKGASVREHAHNERRLKYPMKLVNGQWTHQVGRGHQRDRRQDAGDPQGLRPRLGLLARFRQIQ